MDLSRFLHHYIRYVFLINATIAGILGAAFIGPIRESIQNEYTISTGTFGTAIAAIALAGVGTGMALLPCIRRLHPFTSCVYALAGSCTGMLIISYAQQVFIIACGFFLVALTTAISGHSNTIIRWVYHDKQRLGVNLLHAVNAGGKVLGPIIVGVVLTSAMPWRWSTFIVAMVQAATLLFILFAWRAGKKLRAPQTNTVSHAPESPSFGRTLVQPSTWYAIAPFAIIAGSEAAFSSLLPLYLMHHHGYSEGTASFMLAIHLCGLLAGRIIACVMPTKTANTTIITTCIACGAASFLVPFVHHEIVLACLVFIAGGPFSATFATFFDSADKALHKDPHLLAVGCSVSATIGIHGCIAGSSLLADWHLTSGLLMGPLLIMLWLPCFLLSPIGLPAQKVSTHPNSN